MDSSSIGSRNISGAGDSRALAVRKDLAARAEFGTDRRRSGRTARARSWTLALTSVVFLFGAAVGRAVPPVNFQGKLTTVPGIGPVLKTQKKDFPLAGKTSYLFHTLQDKRLLEREVRLDGVERADGTFEVERIYTVHDGKLFRVRYYCEVCNIEALEPGICVCCQQPTDLQEIPVTHTGS